MPGPPSDSTDRTWAIPAGLLGRGFLMKPWKWIFIALLLPPWLCSCRDRTEEAGPPPPPPVPDRPYRIALIQMGGSDPDFADVPAASLKQGMKLFQFTEGDYYTLKKIDLKGDLNALPGVLESSIREGADLIAITHPMVLRSMLSRGTEVPRPLVFGVLGDPVVLGAGTSAEQHRPGLTGAFHPFPSQSLLALTKYYLPGAKRVGLLFNGREPLSVAHKEALIREAGPTGLEVLAVDAAEHSDLASAAESLLAAKPVDALGLAAGLGAPEPALIQRSRQAKVPVFGLSERQAQQGAIAAEVPTGDRVGLETGRMIYRVLSGEKPAGIPLARILDTETIVNTKVAETLGITLPTGALRIARAVDESSPAPSD